ncbi:hypothetical protein HBH47_148910 [Parastagonospora nodorum]|nr:hypothetical protein HBH47_148910 [Parastagonospora nodorum]KAH5484719.1 hypothetical protein HBI31_163740 [Parastagonospora nodorum]
MSRHARKNVSHAAQQRLATNGLVVLRNDVEFHGLVLDENEGHLASGAFGTLDSDAKFDSKQLRLPGMSMRPSREIFNLADRVSVVLALFGVVFSGASSEECSLKHAQTHPEQGVLRSLNTRVGPCTNHEHTLFATFRDSCSHVVVFCEAAVEPQVPGFHKRGGG